MRRYSNLKKHCLNAAAKWTKYDVHVITSTCTCICSIYITTSSNLIYYRNIYLNADETKRRILKSLK